MRIQTAKLDGSRFGGGLRSLRALSFITQVDVFWKLETVVAY